MNNTVDVATKANNIQNTLELTEEIVKDQSNKLVDESTNKSDIKVKRKQVKKPVQVNKKIIIDPNNKYICNIQYISYTSIISNKDSLGFIVLFKLNNNELKVVDIISKLISVNLFNDDIFKVYEETELYMIATENNISYDLIGLLPIYIDDSNWNIAKKSLNDMQCDSKYEYLLYEILINALGKMVVICNDDNKFMVKNILETCTRLFIEEMSNEKMEEFKLIYNRYTLDPLLRLPKKIPNNLVFIAKIICGLNSKYLEPMINIHAEQFLTYIEEEEARRNICDKVKQLDEIKVNEIISNLLNISYIKKEMAGDLEFNIKQNFETIIEHININGDLGNNINITDIFNNQNNIYTTFITHSVPFIVENHKYNSYKDIKRIASYINNLYNCDDNVRENNIINKKYNEVLFSDVSAIKFIQKIILNLCESGF